MKKNKIITIIPFKESLKPDKAGAVSLFATDSKKYSKFKNDIKIISSEKVNKVFRNKNYILDFCKKNKNKKIDIVEIHNRPEYVRHIRHYFPKTKIILFFHNDPETLRGSENITDRENLLNICNKIIFISRWIQNKFFTGFVNSNYLDTEIIHHGVEIPKKTNFKKDKNILFVGKLNEAKGYRIFVEAAKMFKKYDKRWNFISIGNEPRKKIFPDRNIINEIGYKTNQEVLDYYSKSEISVGNSVWNEPLGRIAIESSSRHCLPIISNKAGLNESKKIAYTLKENSPKELFKILKKFTQNKNLRNQLQNKYYLNNKFNIKITTSKLDLIRFNLLENKNKKKII
jgi:glycosyltransferase involved in cell wall biosynthesis